jgi:hypothetical protein
VLLQVACKNAGCECARVLLSLEGRLNWIDFIGIRRRKGRQLRSVLLLGLFLSVLAMVSSATLHKEIHPQAGRGDHSCAATMLASGQVEAAPSVAAVLAIPLIPIVLNLVEVPSPSVASYNLPLSRGPPALLS